MPYNTRRKSVSLSLLGIHIPNTPRSASHRSPPATTTSTTMPPLDDQPPPKKLKRENSTASSPRSPIDAPKPLSPKVKHEHLPTTSRLAETTPPPSPRDVGSVKIDTEGIKDEIVVGVIEQLEKTGNRPHLLKELAAILQHTLSIVGNSANQPAIISSRLTTYMKRPWTALAPCPLGKELVGTHPKRIYFFLTTQPRQPFPEPPETPGVQHRIISPSLTSDEKEEEHSERRRSEMSPSPEVDLSTSELDDEHSPMSSSGTFSIADSQTSIRSYSRQTNPPPLEGMEKEFTQMAFTLQERQIEEALKRESLSEEPVYVKVEDDDAVMMEFEESEDAIALHNREAADTLFGGFTDSRLGVQQGVSFPTSSPMLRPQIESKTNATFGMVDIDASVAWRSPETVELEELDDLFEAY